MQTVQDRKCSNLVPDRWGIELHQTLPIQTLMGTSRIEIVNIFFEYPLDLSFIQDQYMV